MSNGNVYLWYNRIITQKQVDKELKKIGTWREKISPKELLALVLSIALLLGTVIYCKSNNKQHKAINNVGAVYPQQKTR